jgi:hypothetical protein
MKNDEMMQWLAGALLFAFLMWGFFHTAKYCEKHPEDSACGEQYDDSFNVP